MGTGRLRKFRFLSGREKRLFLEAFFFHVLAGLILKVVPFRRIPGMFGSRQYDTPTLEEDQSRHSVSGRPSEDIELIRMAVQRAGSVSPWRNRCLVSSLAGRCMFRRRKIESQLFLGMTKDGNGKSVAHAWLKSGDTEVVSMNGDYISLYVF